MRPSSSPTLGVKSAPCPIGEGERLPLLDALCGFALGGVCLSNVFAWFSGRVFLPRPRLEAMFANASAVDFATMIAFGALVFGKFITLFSFLFGLGFAVQRDGALRARAEERVERVAEREHAPDSRS
jgi:uncharacterized protein